GALDLGPAPVQRLGSRDRAFSAKRTRSATEGSWNVRNILGRGSCLVPGLVDDNRSALPDGRGEKRTASLRKNVLLGRQIPLEFPLSLAQHGYPPLPPIPSGGNQP